MVDLSSLSDGWKSGRYRETSAISYPLRGDQGIWACPFKHLDIRGYKRSRFHMC